MVFSFHVSDKKRPILAKHLRICVSSARAPCFDGLKGFKKMNVSDFDKLKFALSAYNDGNRQSNRMWSASALFAVFVFTARYSAEDRSILGLSLDSEFALPAAIIVLSGLNIAYSVAHVSVYRIAAVYQSIVREHFGKDVPATKDFSWFDLAQRAPISNFNRLYPLFLPVERNLGRGFYIFFKTVYE